MTILISVLAMALAVSGGLAVSLVRRYGGRVASLLATGYVELFRGTPVLLQLYVLYNMANLDRERRDFSSGAELYEATASLAQRICECADKWRQHHV